MAYDLYPLKNYGAARGFGRIGNWTAAKPVAEVMSLVKTIFQVSAVKVWGRPPQAVQRLAVLGGGGGEFIQAARDRGGTRNIPCRRLCERYPARVKFPR